MKCPETLPQVLGYDEIAALCEVDRETVTRAAWRKKYGLPGRIVGRALLVTREQLLAWIESAGPGTEIDDDQDARAAVPLTAIEPKRRVAPGRRRRGDREARRLLLGRRLAGAKPDVDAVAR